MNFALAPSTPLALTRRQGLLSQMSQLWRFRLHLHCLRAWWFNPGKSSSIDHTIWDGERYINIIETTNQMNMAFISFIFLYSLHVVVSYLRTAPLSAGGFCLRLKRIMFLSAVSSGRHICGQRRSTPFAAEESA